MSKLKISEDRCKACGICIRECPKQALSFTSKMNKKGFQFVTVNHEKCIQCGICYHMCPDCVFELEV